MPKHVSLVVLLVVWAAAGPALAQIHTTGLDFDSTPVELGSVSQAEPRAMTSMDLLTMRNFYGVQISPSGKTVAFVVGQAVYDTNSYRSGLFVINTSPGSVPKRLGSAGPPRWDLSGEWEPEAPKWSPDSRYLAYRIKTNGIWQVWRWDHDGSNRLQMTHANSDVVDFSWSKDGKEIEFDTEKPIPPQTIQQIEERGMLYEGLTAVFNNKSVMQQEMEQLPKETEEWTINIDSGEERKLTGEEQAAREAWKLQLGDTIVDVRKWASGQGNIVNPRLSPDGTKAIFWAVDKTTTGHNSYPLYLKTLGGGPPVVLDPGIPDVTAYWWGSDSQHIYYSAVKVDGHSRYLFVASTDGKPPVLLFPLSRASGYLQDFSVSDSGRFAAGTVERDTVPPRIAFIDLQNATVRTLVDINPEFTNLKLSPATRIEWVSKYGERGRGYFLKPLNYEPGKRYPLIVVTYSAGDYFLRGGGGDEYPIQVFAANGFAVLAWDAGVQPTPGKDGDFEQAMLRFRWPSASLEAALATVDELGIVDMRRCGLTGWSYGTEIVDFVVSHHPELFATAITTGMTVNEPYFYYLAPKFFKDMFKNAGLGLPDKKTCKRWHELSSSLNAERIHTPILSNASEDDFVAGLQLYTTLEDLEKPVELFVYPNEVHFKVQPKHLYEIYERNVDWFRFWLQGVEDPASGKKAQYERWHHLRDLHERDLVASGKDAQPK